MKYPLLCFLIYFVGSGIAHAQTPENKTYDQESTDLIEVLLKAMNIAVKEKPPGQKRISFSFIPVSTVSAGGNKVFVSSINAAFVLGHEDSTNVSNVYLLPYTDFYEDIGLGVRFNLWSARNKWNVPGEFRFSHLSQYSYGLGSSTESSDRFKIKYNNVRMYVAANRLIARYLYAGPGINYDRYYDLSHYDTPTSPSDFEKYGVGTDASSYSTGITFNLLRDSRRNSLNPDNGFYSSAVYRLNPSWLTNDNAWSSLYLDSRKYFPFGHEKRKILAIWAFYWGSYGHVPYMNLPGTQLEAFFRSGRGYQQGRFRGKQMLYLETEYRFDITNNGLLGGVVFANAQSLTEPLTEKFQYVNPAAGFGARVKFNKRSNTNLTLDLGFGKNSVVFYIGLGEYF